MRRTLPNLRRPTLPLSLMLLLLALAGSIRATAQALYTATGPGARWTIGGTGSLYEADYGNRYLAGGSAFVDFARSERVNYEAEVRLLTIHEEVGTHESTYLAGLKIPFHRRWGTPYAKLLGGIGKFYYPYGYAQGSYFVVAPGAGYDVNIPRARLTVRLIDLEYQGWVNFPFGMLRPYGVSSGLALRFN